MMMQVAGFTGAVAAVLVGIGLYTSTGTEAWRWMLLSAVVPAVAVFLLRRGTPESPYWLALSSARTVSEMASLRTRLGRYQDLFLKRYRARVLFILLYWFLGNVTGSGLLLYAPILAKNGFHLTGTAALYFTAILDGCYLLANVILATWLVDRYGRRRISLIGWVGSAISAAVLAAVVGSVILGLVFFAVSTILLQSAVDGIFWPWSVELFPTRLRATGQGVASAAGKIGGLLSVLFLPDLLASEGLRVVMIITATLVAGGAVLTASLGWETKELSLGQLDDNDLQTTTPVR